MNNISQRKPVYDFLLSSSIFLPQLYFHTYFCLSLKFSYLSPSLFTNSFPSSSLVFSSPTLSYFTPVSPFIPLIFLPSHPLFTLCLTMADFSPIFSSSFSLFPFLAFLPATVPTFHPAIFFLAFPNSVVICKWTERLLLIVLCVCNSFHSELIIHFDLRHIFVNNTIIFSIFLVFKKAVMNLQKQIIMV